MDEDCALIDALCTRIGMIMEDASVVALAHRGGDRGERVAVLARAIGQMAALIAAAKAVGSQ